MTIYKQTKLKYTCCYILFVLVIFNFYGFICARETVSDTKIINNHFDTIRQNPVLLRQFLLEMPKGGDLHHHVSGATYAEDLIDLYAEKGVYIDSETLRIVESPKVGDKAVPISRAYEDDSFYERIILNWSMYNFNTINGTANDHFFNLFSKISSGGVDYAELIKKLRYRAASENLSYIEAMVRLRSLSSVVREMADKIASPEEVNDKKGFLRYRKKLISQKKFKKALKYAVKELEDMHKRSNYPGCPVKVRYQFYALRTFPKVQVLAELVTAFEIAQKSPLVLGVNIVGPENNHTARKNYHLHMEMFAVIGALYPGVKRSLHAGELVLGQAVPEALRFHVTEAVNVAGANRIGHGTDVAYEIGFMDTVRMMKEKKIAVEILLTSNEQLLGVKGKRHPFPFYVSSGVPVVLAGDDPGMMRTTQTQEFFLAASRYNSISYTDLKGFARNSLQYSFLDDSTKGELMGKLDMQFCDFEKKWRTYILSTIETAVVNTDVRNAD